jgi:hypothetical protein
MTDALGLAAEAGIAIERLEQLEKDNASPSAIAAARVELRLLKRRLEDAKTDIVLTATMAKALARPFKMKA